MLRITLKQIESSQGGVEPVLIVSKLKPGSPAAYAGLRPGDIILSVNKLPVNDFKSFEKALKKNGQGLLLNIQRGRRALFLLVR